MYDFFSESVVIWHWLPDRPPFKRKLSEDYFFCYLAGKAGLPVYVDTVCQCGHVGTVDFLQVAQLLQKANGGR